MHGPELVQAARKAAHKIQDIVQRICGACQDSCCESGTMVGSHGLRRLHKGLRLDSRLAGRLRQGLRERAKEIRADLETIERVTELLRVTYAQDHREEFARLDDLVEQWRQFAHFIASDFELTAENLTRLTAYTAIRHNLLRQLTVFPGAHSALANLCSPGGSFRFRGRRLAPPRCIFLLEGCLLGRYKPLHCANFFCTGDPNLLEECQKRMDFDEFVLANMYTESYEFVRQALELENELGRTYWEPKIILTAKQQHGAELRELVHQRSGRVEVRQEIAGFYLSSEELLSLISAHGRDNTIVFTAPSVGSPALYELGIALQQAHNEDILGGFVLIAESFAAPSFMPHPMWSDCMMSQPLGSLDIFAVEQE